MKGNIHQRGLILIVIMVLALGIGLAARPADTGPKPTMSFNFVFEGDPIEIISGKLLECDQPDCSDGAPLEKGGPQRFECTATGCRALAYSFDDYHQLVIEFSDKTRTSNVFEKHLFASQYTVQVDGDGLEVSGEMRGLLDACLCSSWLSTLALETLTAGLLFALLQLPRRLLGWIPLASLITLPAVWFLFPLLPVSALWVIALAEVFAVAAEALLLVAVGRGVVRWTHAVFISLVMNAVSFGIGWFFLV